MSPSSEGRSSGGGGPSGLRRLSALRLIPEPNAALGTHLFLRTLGSLAVALLVVAGLGAREAARERRDGREVLAGVELDALEARLAGAVSRALPLARRLAADPAVVEAARDALTPSPSRPARRSVHEGDAARLLKDVIAAHPEMLSASLVDAGGGPVASTGEPAAPDDAGRQADEWWGRAREAGADIALGGPGTGLPPGALSVAVAVDDPSDGRRVGVVRVVASPPPLPAAGPDLAVAFDRAGRPLPPGRGPFALLPDDPVFSALASATDGTAAPAFAAAGHDVRARRVSGALGRSELRGWWLAVASPRDDGARSGAGPSAVPYAIVLLLLLATAFLLPTLRKMTRDLTALVEYARRTGAGDTAASPPHVLRNDEIGALGTALVGALEGLRSSRVELERGKRSLEERVEARTSELARLNQELKKRAEELAAASRSKDEFLANISHELRTPLNSIIGLTQLVRDGLADTPEEATTFLDQVLHSSRHLLTLINDVLDLAKLEAGKVELALEPLDAAEVVEEVRKIVEPLARQKGLALEVSVAEGLPNAKADRVRLRQVLVNVAQNAIKFTTTGHVRLRVRTSDGRRKLLLEVEDTGIGIPPEKRALVFEKFIQAEAGTTRRFGGTGLGLPISRLLVEAMGGAIGIEPGADGTGTRVWFTVPTPGLEGR